MSRHFGQKKKERKLYRYSIHIQVYYDICMYVCGVYFIYIDGLKKGCLACWNTKKKKIWIAFQLGRRRGWFVVGEGSGYTVGGGSPVNQWHSGGCFRTWRVCSSRASSLYVCVCVCRNLKYFPFCCPTLAPPLCRPFGPALVSLLLRVGARLARDVLSGRRSFLLHACPPCPPPALLPLPTSFFF